MSIPILQVDAFAEAPFTGNPAAVCILPAARPDAWLQAVAGEMNLSETAFLLREEGGFHLRWFTPAVEVDLCGHATLASAHVLWEEGHLPLDRQARFRTRSGILGARREASLIWLDFPAQPPRETTAPPELLEALGVQPRAVRWLGRNRDDYLVELDGEYEVRRLAPDMARLGRVECRGVIVTAPADGPDADFVSRFFGPRVGVPEDPVTGSAHCCLGPHWGARLGRRELLGYQVSVRGGRVRVRLEGERVKLGGVAVTVLRGELLG